MSFLNERLGDYQTRSGANKIFQNMANNTKVYFICNLKLIIRVKSQISPYMIALVKSANNFQLMMSSI